MTTKLAIVFPGQGSQSVGMLADLYAEFDIVKQTFTEASDALGYDLWALVANGPEADLNETHRTQPALLTASVAVWRLWQQRQHIGMARMPLLLGALLLLQFSLGVANIWWLLPLGNAVAHNFVAANLLMVLTLICARLQQQRRSA